MKIGSEASAVARWKKPGKKKPSKHFLMRNFAHTGKNPYGIVNKFCMLVDIQDLITCTTFGDDLYIFRFGRGEGRISRFSIDCVVALTTLSHYRTNVR